MLSKNLYLPFSIVNQDARKCTEFMVITTALYIFGVFLSLNLILSSWTRSVLLKSVPANVSSILEEKTPFSVASINPIKILLLLDLICFVFCLSFTFILFYSMIKRYRKLTNSNVNLTES